MALNKVNIEFLREHDKQMDKVLEDIEKLKDANREIHTIKTVADNDRNTSVVGLLMFINGEIKEAVVSRLNG